MINTINTDSANVLSRFSLPLHGRHKRSNRSVMEKPQKKKWLNRKYILIDFSFFNLLNVCKTFKRLLNIKLELIKQDEGRSVFNFLNFFAFRHSALIWTYCNFPRNIHYSLFLLIDVVFLSFLFLIWMTLNRLE